MSREVVYSTSLIENSITNSSTGDDVTSPFSFLEFITRTRVDYGPEEYNNFYLTYLQEWNIAKGQGIEDAKNNTVQVYVEFLKEVTLSFTTQQEKRFLNTLDFNDPVDLDIIIPFYAEKIRDIILFYKEKRDQGKYIVDRNKIKGTRVSIEKALYESIYNYIFAAEDTPAYNATSLTLSSLRANLGIDVQEYVDVYGNYFDIPRDDSQLTRTNSNDINATLFFDDPTTIFRSSVFLREIPLAINATLSYDNICDPENPLVLQENECEDVTGITATQRTQLKRQLLRKYAGVDCYYINTTTNPPTSGRLFTAENPIGNIENLQTVDTPIVPSGVNKLLRDVGLFFTPDTAGVLKLDVSSLEYAVNFDALEEGKVYVFPDPSIYGNVSLNKQEVYPIIHTYDARGELRNISSGFIKNDPYIRSEDQTISPYFAKEQIDVTRELTPSNALLLNFKDLYNSGYITKYQTDIFGNEYALFKDEFGYTFNGPATLSDDSILNLLLNGHVFFDIEEGYNFNYSTVSRQGTTIRSGLTSHTVEDESAPAFSQTTNPYYLFFRNFRPYQELNTQGAFDFTGLAQNRVLTVDLRDSGSFVLPNNTPLPDPILADSINWPSSQQYYYTALYDGGVASLSPLSRAIISTTPSLTGDFTNDVRFVLSGINAAAYDGGYFTDTLNTGISFGYQDQYAYYDAVSPDSSTIVSSITGSEILPSIDDRRQLQGKIFVTEQKLSESTPLSTKLEPTFNKYPLAVRNEVYNSPLDFDIVYDTVVVETSNYLVFDKINYDGGYRKPSTVNIYHRRDDDNFKKFSNRFFKEADNTITYCILDTLKPIEPSPSYMYGADSRGVIWQVDIENATQVPVLSAGSVGAINGMSFDSTRRHMFLVSGSNRNLYFWNLSSSSFVSLGSLNQSPWNLNLTASPTDGVFYQNAHWFFYPHTSNLVKVSFSYASPTPSITSINVFQTDIPFVPTTGDIVINPNTGVLYGSGRSIFFSLCVTSPTNSYNLISQLPTSQLCFDKDYTKIYGHNYSNGEWYSISPDTGVTTPIRFTSSITPNLINNVGYRDLCGMDNVFIPTATSITEGLAPTKTLTIFPTIYQYDIKEGKTNKLYPLTTDIQNIKNIFSLDSVITDDFAPTFTHISKPVVTYNTLNGLYKLTYTCYDNNNLSYIFDRTFDVTPNGVIFTQNKLYKPSKTALTTDFSHNNFTITSVVSGKATKDSVNTTLIV
jgi:hypothetical protein